MIPTLWLVMLIGGISGASDDECIRVRMEAHAPGTGLAARRAAVEKAEREIIRQVLAANIAHTDLPALDALLDRSTTYIRSTQLVRYTTGENSTQVEIESYVKHTVLLEDAAKTLLPRMTAPPSVLILIAEQPHPSAAVGFPEPGIAETALAEGLRETQLDVASPAAVRGHYREVELLNLVQQENDVAGWFAQQSFADVAILGQAATSLDANEGGVNVFAVRARVTVRLFRAVDGRLIEALTREAVVHCANPIEGGVAAIQDACAKLIRELIMPIVLAAAGERLAEDVVMLTVEAPGNRVRFDLFLEAVQHAIGGAAVEELFFLETLARLRFTYSGPMGILVDELTERQYDGCALELVRVDRRRVVMRFRP